jgi:iron complex outermembrane receptor protein
MRTSLATALLLASTALTAPSWAQTAAAPTAAAPTSTPTPATPASSNSTQTVTGGTFGGTLPTDIGRVKAKGETTPSGVTRVDLGGGLMIQEDQPKSRSTVTRDFIAKQASTSNPYQLVEMLPGANINSPDAAGLNGGNITLRGFNSDQIGLTIDGAPVNDSGNYALYPQEYLDSENIGQISIAQGFQDLDSPHIGATGGVVNVYSRDPSKTAGGLVGLSYGTRNVQREFVRIETGQIGRVRGYFSYSHYQANHWRGPGTDNRDHFDAKVVADIGEQSKITLSAIYNDAVNNFYVAPTLANFNQFGATGFQNNYDRTYNPGGTANNQNTGTNGYYKFRINPFKNLIMSAPATFAVTDNLTVDVTPYLWWGYGSGGGVSSLSESGFNFGGNKISQDLNGNGTRTDKINYYLPSITETYRPGIINKATYQLGNQKLIAGYWYEAALHKQYGTGSLLNADGSVADAFNEGNNLIITSGPFAGQKYQKRNTITNTRTNVLFVGDSISLLDDRLTVDVGVKQAFISRHGQNLLPSGANAAITAFRNASTSETLPVLGANLKLDDKNSIFGGLSTSFRTPQNYALFDSVSATSSSATNGFTRGGVQKPERAISMEFGHRFQGERIASSVSVWGYHYQGRQFQTNIPDPSGNGSFISQNINGGNSTGYGVDFEVGTRPINNVRYYVSGELNRITLDGDIQTSSSLNGRTINDYLPTRGKYAPQAPSILFGIGMDYDDGSLFAGVKAKYVGRQFSSFTNDESIPGSARVDAMIGYRLGDIGPAKKPEIKLNLYNIADQSVLTGVSGVNATAKNITGRNGGTISGSAPSYYVGQGFAAIVSLTSGF